MTRKVHSFVPVAVAIDAHGMAAVWQNHFGTRLQADPAFIFPLHVCIRALLLVLVSLPHHHLQVLTPLLSHVELRRIAMEALK